MYIVTGGGGFIGSVLAAHLNEAGCSDIVIVDRFGASEKWLNIAKCDFFEIVAIEQLWDWLDQFDEHVDAVFHLGAYGDETAGFDDRGDIAAFKRLRPLNLYGWSKHAFDLWAMCEAAVGRAPPVRPPSATQTRTTSRISHRWSELESTDGFGELYRYRVQISTQALTWRVAYDAE